MPQEFRRAFTLVEIMIVAVIIGVILAIAIPNYLKFGAISKQTVCINNLKKIDGAIDQWVLDHAVSSGAVPTSGQEEEIYSYVKGGEPSCPSGGQYAIGQIGANPQVRCSREDLGHTLAE